MTKILVIGVNKPGHVGRLLVEAAQSKGDDARIVDTTLAMSSNRLVQSIAWRAAHYPLLMNSFNKLVKNKAEELDPDIIITTGIAPLSRKTVKELQEAHKHIVNYSTDDPWNPAHKSQWFIKTLSAYTKLFTTRRSNINDFQKVGVKSIEWLPFAIDPRQHYPESRNEQTCLGRFVALIGGADKERVRLVTPLIKAGIEVKLWGGYWDRFRITRPYWQGMADEAKVRGILSNTCCALTLVRRANRDGHAMRTYEVAAMAAPALAEKTQEHEEILGQEGKTAIYFSNTSELINKARWMISNPDQSKEMGLKLRHKIVKGGNTYAERLKQILNVM